MRITLDLATDERLALRRLAAELGNYPLEEAARLALRDYLISSGYLDLPADLDEDTETMGEA